MYSVYLYCIITNSGFVVCYIKGESQMTEKFFNKKEDFQCIPEVKQ